MNKYSHSFLNGDEADAHWYNGYWHWYYSDGAGWILHSGKTLTMWGMKQKLKRLNGDYDDYREELPC